VGTLLSGYLTATSIRRKATSLGSCEIAKRGYEEAACTDPKLPFFRCKRWAAALPRMKSVPARR
jgi:hypothetical protein